MAKRLKWWHPLRSSGSPSPTTSQSPHLYIHVPLLQTKFKNCEAHIKIGRPSAFADISIQELLASAHMSSTVTYIHVRAHTCTHKTLPCPSCQCWWMAIQGMDSQRQGPTVPRLLAHISSTHMFKSDKTLLYCKLTHA